MGRNEGIFHAIYFGITCSNAFIIGTHNETMISLDPVRSPYSYYLLFLGPDFKGIEKTSLENFGVVSYHGSALTHNSNSNT